MHSKEMNIMQIGTIDQGGGAASISWQIKKALEKEGFPTSMFVADKNSNDPNIHVIPRTAHRYTSYIRANDIDIFDTDWIMKTEEYKKADLIHCHNLHGWFFNLETLEKMSKEKSVVWTLHDMWAVTSHCAHGFDGELKDGFYQCQSLKSYPRILWPNDNYLESRKKNIYENSDFTVVVPSKWMREKIEPSVLGDKKLKLIYNGVDKGIFKKGDRMAARKELNLPEDKKVVLVLGDGGHKNEYKGWGYIEKVIRQYKDDGRILFVSVGGRPADFSGLPPNNVLFIPQAKTPESMAKYYSAADVFLYSPLAESFGLVVAESMACGTPVVTFATGGIPEIVVHKETGYLAEYRNVDDLQRGLDYIFDQSPQDLARISAKSAEQIKENFELKKMTDNYIELYKSLI